MSWLIGFRTVSCRSKPTLFLSQVRCASNVAKNAHTIIEGTRKIRPFTPGQRHARLADRSMLWKGHPVWDLTKAKRKTGGRQASGKIAVRGRGGGHKRRYRLIDFKRSIIDVAAVCERLEYDPNRSAHIALMNYPDGTQNYIIAPKGVEAGSSIISTRTKDLDMIPGNAMPLGMIPLGQQVHNVELVPGKGGQLGRSAGSYMTVLERGIKNKYVKVEMMSKEHRLIHMKCLATIGQVSNVNHNQIVYGKAGRRRNLGWRPKVRGVAMNPVDHPHGGGEGKSKGRLSVSKWGKPTKGYRTRSKHHKLNKFRVERRPVNKNRYKNTIVKHGYIPLKKGERPKPSKKKK